jgi:hypothetical protein
MSYVVNCYWFSAKEMNCDSIIVPIKLGTFAALEDAIKCAQNRTEYMRQHGAPPEAPRKYIHITEYSHREVWVRDVDWSEFGETMDRY